MCLHGGLCSIHFNLICNRTTGPRVRASLALLCSVCCVLEQDKFIQASTFQKLPHLNTTLEANLTLKEANLTLM